VLDQLEQRQSEVATAMRRAVLSVVPDYAASGEPDLLAEVQGHALEHVHTFIASARAGRPPEDAELEFVRVRAVQRERDGMPLAALLHAYRLGMREVWGVLAELAARENAPPQTLMEITAVAMAYTDAISLAVTDAYSRTAARRRGDLERERRDLLEDLLAGRDVEARADELGIDRRLPLAVVVAARRLRACHARVPPYPARRALAARTRSSTRRFVVRPEQSNGRPRARRAPRSWYCTMAAWSPSHRLAAAGSPTCAAGSRAPWVRWHEQVTTGWRPASRFRSRRSRVRAKATPRPGAHCATHRPAPSWR
jgi:hypothetical protein